MKDFLNIVRTCDPCVIRDYCRNCNKLLAVDFVDSRSMTDDNYSNENENCAKAKSWMQQ